MKAIATTVIVTPDGKITLQLPPDIPPGEHQVGHDQSHTDHHREGQPVAPHLHEFLEEHRQHARPGNVKLR